MDEPEYSSGPPDAPTDDEILQGLYDQLNRCSRMREPRDPAKRAAFLAAHEKLDEAREALEAPYRKDLGDERP